MSVSEYTKSNKNIVDDTHPLKCTILNTRNTNGYTEYVIEVIRISADNCSWKIFKRYSDFVKLQNALNKYSSKINLELPPKKLIGNMDRKLVMQRQDALQNCLNIIVENIMLANTLMVRSFLDPETYKDYCKDFQFQKVGMILRGNKEFELFKELPSIGWRVRKKSFLSKWKKDTKQEFLLSWTECGPDLILRQQDLNSVLKSISSIIHPLVDVPVVLPSPEGFTLSIHNIQVGSLRDLLYQTTPLQPFLKKYWDISNHVYLPEQTVISYVKQILFGLKFLHENRIPYGHLHSGNVLVCDIENIKLTGIENSTMGLSPYYRPFLVCLGKKRIQSLCDVDVYGFGHILYELTENEPLLRPSCEHFSLKTSINFTKQLKNILAPSSSKLPMPKVNTVITHLKHANIIEDEKDTSFFKCKLPNVVKEQYTRISDQCMSRIFEDQKKISLEKRHKKIYKIIHEPDNLPDETKSKNFEFYSIKSVNANENTVRSDSSSSNSTIASLGSDVPTSSNNTLAVIPIPPPPPSLFTSTSNGHEENNQRVALLSSISSFDPSKLKKVAKKITY
ncbi:PX domain-containing protein kinase-like protein isoform X2 [Daktulosphaira vitifoliae]|uniref:PX domain-containing protein kinase-like protein isoform X2 n=1 Tax=Daktulosphaira vitifoliae TaxID=58002 RepID=UPI0021AA9682|nr:PX domain-containing protein kinase-like protein isoform X2 [Daktulosphaira vitifoliae]